MARSPLQRKDFDDGRAATRLCPVVALARCAVVLFLFAATSAHAARSCADWSAELTAVEGTVELLRSSSSTWTAATSGERICTGDTVRTQGFSRATVTLPDQSTLRLDEHSTFGIPEPKTGVGSLIELVRGVLHVISRDPRSLRFTTPFANAGLEGTEFDIRVSEERAQTEVVVLEGEVVVTSPAGQIHVPSGRIARARAGAPPTSDPLAQPIELMRWAAHYRPIVDGQLPDPDQEPTPEQRGDAAFFAKRAEARLATAQLDGARSDLNAAQRLVPRYPTALALEAMLALARGDRTTARESAAAAVAGTPKSAAALLALAHVQQSDTALAGATRSAMQALELEPDNALALALLAELALSQGDTAASMAHATRAQRLAPTRSEPATVLGFARLRGFDLAGAHAAFTQAAALEPAAPLPRLGLAMTAIQQGDLLGGRQQLELAVALNPADAITRSYMASVYSTEHRGKLPASQLDLAMAFNPFDPTPWLYSALEKLRSNRPIEALQDLRAATEKNGNRTVLRSSLGMHEDLATRSAGIGRLHTELGFGQLALVEAWRAVADEPADYASHRRLADVYAATPRHEIARVSELLLSQLLQPANLTPIKAQLAQPSMFIAGRAGPSDSAFNELSSPVMSNGLQLQVSSGGGSNGTVGEDVSVSGLHDRVSYSAGQFRFATDGFLPNNDLDQRVANGFVQFRPDSRTSLQAELRANRTERGDINLYFDPLIYDATARIHENADSIRLGARRDVTAKDTLLASVIYQETDATLANQVPFYLEHQTDGYGVDLQHIRAARAARVQSGMSYSLRDEQILTSISLPGLPFPLTNATLADASALSLYSYAHFAVRPALTFTAGVSLDRINNLLIDEQAVNPKLGVLWKPMARTTIRAAAFESLYSSLTTSRHNLQPRLEPVQVAGFSQLLFGGASDRATVRGLALDHTLTERLFVGWEATHRDIESVATDVVSAPPRAIGYTTSERTQQAYLYWTPHDRLSVSARYERGRYHSTPIQPQSYSDLKLDRLPVELRYFAPTGLTAGLRASHLRERGVFLQTGAVPGGPEALAPGGDDFWVLDTFIGYRLPNRRGVVSLNADNLLNERFRFQDVDPDTPSVMPERLLSLRFTIAFD